MVRKVKRAEEECVRTVRAVNHHDLRQVLLPQCFPGSLDALLVKVCTLASTAEDNEAVLITSCPGDGSQTLLCHTHEMMLGSGSTDSIDGDGQASIGTVLEANGEGETRGQLTMQLRFGGTSTNGTERNQIGEELWGDCVEHLGCDWHALGGQVAVELARDTQALVDLVALVDVGVVDETLPANGRPWLLEVGTHDDEKLSAQLLGESLETVTVLEGGLRVVDGAWADHDEETVVLLGDDLDAFFAAAKHRLLGGLCDGDLGGQELGRDQRVVAEDWESDQRLGVLWCVTGGGFTAHVVAHGVLVGGSSHVCGYGVLHGGRWKFFIGAESEGVVQAGLQLVG